MSQLMSTLRLGSRLPNLNLCSLNRSSAATPFRCSLKSQVRSFSAAFDVFQKLKDPADAEGAKKDNKRKPSDKVLNLADQIMGLTLIEAADLCDLCQDRLTPGDGSPIPGRMPFPHPGGMFGSGMPMMGMPMMGGGGMPQMQAAPAAPAPAAEEAPAEEAAPAAEKKKEEASALVTLKLVSFDDGKKIGVIKEVRALTGLGLKESKDLVENVPKVLQKGVPRADAQAIIDKFKTATAKVEIS